MIGYYLQQYGKDKNGDIFNTENIHYDSFQEKRIVYPNYGYSLKLLLIQYHLSTSNNILNFDEEIKIRKKTSNYSSKEKAISVIIPVILDEYLGLSPKQRKQKFADDALYAVTLVRDRLQKKKLDIDFDKLLLDLEKCNKEYLA